MADDGYWAPDVEQWVTVYESTADQTVTLPDPYEQYRAVLGRAPVNDFRDPADMVE